MFCRHCGQAVSAEAELCSHCGESLKKTMHVTVEKGTRYVTWVWLAGVFSVLALFWWPVIFGGIGIYSGFRAMEEGNEKAGKLMMVIATACLLTGLLFFRA